MANKKLTDLTELTSIVNNDLVYVVDVSDTTESAEGTSKKIKAINLVTDGLLAETMHASFEKTSLVDADELNGTDSDADWSLIRVTCLNIWNYIKSKAASVFQYKLTAGTNITIDNTDPLNPIISSSGGGASVTNLSYTPSATNGIVTSDTGTDATIPLADGTNAGLLKPEKFTVLENTSGTNTGDQQLIFPVTETGTSFSLADANNGKITILTASCTVTIPNGLVAGFEHTIVTLAGVTLTVALGGSVTLFNNVGTTMAEKLSCTIKNRTATNQYITAGNL